MYKEFPRVGHAAGKDYDNPDYYKLRNICAACGPGHTTRRENYDMMWGEADLICNNCNGKIRDLDYG